MDSMDRQQKHRMRVSTALLLAAGTGSRLKPLTDNAPKCLTEVGGIPILKRLLDCLRELRFKRLVVVVGHLEQHIRKFLDLHAGDLIVDYVVSPVYQTTNNIYSLWLARQAIQEPFLLIESDLVFNVASLGKMLYPNQIAVSDILPWMNGTSVTATASLNLTAFYPGLESEGSDIHFKTVNIYSLSLESWRRVGKRLDEYIRAGRVNEYYEAVFEEMAADGSLAFHCVKFDNAHWYEVDTLKDLHEAELLFSKRRESVLSRSANRAKSLHLVASNSKGIDPLAPSVKMQTSQHAEYGARNRSAERNCIT